MPPPSSSPPARTIHAGGSLPLRHRPAQPGGHRPAGGPAGGNTLTALRTGAIGGLAAKHLAREDAATAGLVGCGVQGLHQLTFLCQVRPIRTVYLYNHGSKDLGPFCRQLEAMVAPKPLAIEICPDPDTLLAKSDIVVTATPAKAPLFADDPAPFRGKCLIAIGSWQPDMRRFPRPSGRPPGRSFWSSPSPARRAATCASPWPPAP